MLSPRIQATSILNYLPNLMMKNDDFIRYSGSSRVYNALADMYHRSLAINDFLWKYAFWGKFEND